jgi:hypothetical protein
MDRGEEIIGLNGAAAVLDVPPETVRRFAQDGRLRSEGGEEGEYVFHLEDVLGLARELGAESAEEEIFEGEIMGDETVGTSRLPAVPFERYERLLQQGQDYKTRLEERTRQIEEIRQERDAATASGPRSNASTSSSSSANCRRRRSRPSKRRKQHYRPSANASSRNRWTSPRRNRPSQKTGSASKPSSTP